VPAGDREVDDIHGSDVVVLLSATPQTVGTSRLEYLAKNAGVTDDLANRLSPDWRASSWWSRTPSTQSSPGSCGKRGSTGGASSGTA
jgi:hypothetical protein